MDGIGSSLVQNRREILASISAAASAVLLPARGACALNGIIEIAHGFVRKTTTEEGEPGTICFFRRYGFEWARCCTDARRRFLVNFGDVG